MKESTKRLENESKGDKPKGASEATLRKGSLRKSHRHLVATFFLFLFLRAIYGTKITIAVLITIEEDSLRLWSYSGDL